jgi:hypothetical protein
VDTRQEAVDALFAELSDSDDAGDATSAAAAAAGKRRLAALDDDDDDDDDGADPRAEEVDDSDGGELENPKDKRPRKTGRTNEVIHWSPVCDGMDREQLEEKHGYLAANQCAGGKWMGSDSDSKGWKPRTDGPKGDKEVVSHVKVRTCPFAKESVARRDEAPAGHGGGTAGVRAFRGAPGRRGARIGVLRIPHSQSGDGGAPHARGWRGLCCWPCAPVRGGATCARSGGRRCLRGEAPTGAGGGGACAHCMSPRWPPVLSGIGAAHFGPDLQCTAALHRHAAARSRTLSWHRTSRAKQRAPPLLLTPAPRALERPPPRSNLTTLDTDRARRARAAASWRPVAGDLGSATVRPRHAPPHHHPARALGLRPPAHSTL